MLRGRRLTRADLTKLLRAALGELDLAERVRAALDPAGDLPACVVAIGKAAPAMAAGAVARWGAAIETCLVVTSHETSVDALHEEASRAGIEAQVRVLRSAHPLPDARSIRAGKACLAAVASPLPRPVLVLVSGGASALVAAPIPAISLAQKRAVTRTLLASGATVQELNVVRKHLSRLKGGGLARAAGPSPLQTLIASDVVGGTAADVGSGPTLPDPSSVADARRILRRFAPDFAALPLARSLPRLSAPPRVQIVASPEALAVAVGRLLRAAGERVQVLEPSQASAADLAVEYLARAARAPGVFVRVAEPSVAVPMRARAGAGGRSTHLATLVGRGLSPLRRVIFAAFASDGVDGESGTGGAIVDQRFATRATQRLGEAAVDDALARFDTGALHRALGTALAEAPSGHNLADVHVLIVG